MIYEPDPYWEEIYQQIKSRMRSSKTDLPDPLTEEDKTKLLNDFIEKMYKGDN